MSKHSASDRYGSNPLKSEERTNARRSILPDLPPSAPDSPRSHQPDSAPLTMRALRNWLHPFVWIGLGWGISMLVAGIAAVHLVQIEPLEESAHPPALSESLSQPSIEQFPGADDRDSIQARTPQAQVTPAADNLPFLTLGLMAFSCAIGCFLMSHRSRSKSIGGRSITSPNYRQLPRNPSGNRKRVDFSSRQPNLSPAKPGDSVTSHFSTPAPVAILPPDEAHPLDWDEPSVADNLDLRQRRPLSYWL
ncbi:hypothetical protein [Egbenema bharatensis]|uniref:hypothetical protein n=1 Tax=Egbenema bharatensis TaxID=3463334 RepID=UPI003A8AD5AE